MIKIKYINYSSNNSKLWYYDLENNKYPLFMNTKKGYLVHRPELDDTKTWLIKKGHASIVDDDIV